MALSLDPTYVKAYQRRATARASLKLYQQGKFLFVNIDFESFYKNNGKTMEINGIKGILLKLITKKWKSPNIEIRAAMAKKHK